MFESVLFPRTQTADLFECFRVEQLFTRRRAKRVERTWHLVDPRVTGNEWVIGRIRNVECARPDGLNKFPRQNSYIGKQRESEEETVSRREMEAAGFLHFPVSLLHL